MIELESPANEGCELLPPQKTKQGAIARRPQTTPIAYASTDVPNIVRPIILRGEIKVNLAPKWSESALTVYEPSVILEVSKVGTFTDKNYHIGLPGTGQFENSAQV